MCVCVCVCMCVCMRVSVCICVYVCVWLFKYVKNTRSSINCVNNSQVLNGWEGGFGGLGGPQGVLGEAPPFPGEGSEPSPGPPADTPLLLIAIIWE